MSDAVVSDEFKDVIGDTHGKLLGNKMLGEPTGWNGIENQIPPLGQVRAKPPAPAAA